MGPFMADGDVMNLLAMLFLAISLAASGGGQLGAVGSSLSPIVPIVASSEAPGQNSVSARVCLNQAGAAIPGGILCHSDKRNWEEASEEAAPSWLRLHLRPAVTTVEAGREPAPDLDPPRSLS